MENSNVFFISHRSKDSNQALELYNLLLEINPEWDGRIFLDCCEKKPLESHDEWRARMLREVANSRHLIFIASSLDYIKEGHGWLYEEISHFHNLKINRIEQNRSEFNVSYFGIFLCECDFENSLFNDPLRGNEYRKLFQLPEHLMLGEGATVASAKERIKEKIQCFVSGDDSDDTAALILDKTRRFASEKGKNDYMFNKDSIDENLIPSTLNDENSLNFDELCDTVQKSHVVLLGAEGGCGKTTLLTKLFFNYLDGCDLQNSQRMIPLYVDAKSLLGENHLILRYLAKNLFDEHTAMTARNTSSNVAILDFEFSRNRQTPRYLLIVDGYNEIPKRSIKIFDRELFDFMPNGRYTNVRVVISGRHVGNHLSDGVFEEISIAELDNSAVCDYLASKGIPNKRIKDSLFKILSIPMYLKMYAQTSLGEQIKTKADLLCAFLNWQESKDTKSAADYKTKAIYQVILRHVLPIIAYKMLVENIGGSSFVLTSDELGDLLADTPDFLCEKSYKRFYGAEYRELLRESEFEDYDELELYDFTVNYLVGTCKLLRQNNGSLDFIHQIYRDFFCAWYIVEFIKRSPENLHQCAYVSQKLIDRDIIEFITELLGEDAPFFDDERGIWDYSCNESSRIVSLLDMNRNGSDAGTATVVANVVNMLRYARNDDLSGLDLSGLDLTETALNDCMFYRYDKNGQASTSFAGSVINRENVFTESPFEKILAGCTNETCAACIDSTGVIKIWNKGQVLDYPVKIITDVRYSVLKLLFSSDGKSLLAMTAHEILEIPIHQEFSSKAEPRVIFKTAKRLRDIAIGQDSKILFTTNLNSFNFKSIQTPVAPDNYEFYGINSAATVNMAGDRLAFGHFTGYEGLMIYDFLSETETWKERKFGYSAILNDYFIELEELFQKANLYRYFPTDNEGYDTRRTYFSYMQQQFEDCTHDHGRIPAIIAKRCRNKIRFENGIVLDRFQYGKLKALVAKYESILKDELRNNNLLMLIAGRKITSVCFKRGSNTLLISCSINYREKLEKQRESKKLYKNKAYDNLVLELDTDTFKARFITRSISNHPLYASYCADDIVVVGKYHFEVYDNKGDEILHVESHTKSILCFLTPKNKNTFYAVSQRFIYEFDSNLHCVRSIDNVFNSVNLSYVVNSKGEEYIAYKRSLESQSLDLPIKVIDLSCGRAIEINGGEFEIYGQDRSVSLADMSFKSCNEKLVSFKNRIKKSEIEVPYKLFVCGCDFRGVRGNITEPRYMRMLYAMGAVTDEVEIPEATVIASNEGFTPSSAELIFPESIKEKRSLFAFYDGSILESDGYFSDAKGGNNFYEQKTWALINRRSFLSNGLEGADYSILEWVDSFNFAHSNMLANLVDAGIIERPIQYSDVKKRLVGPLHKSFKFVFRTRFRSDESASRTPIYTVCFPYGDRILQHITGLKRKNQLISTHSINAVNVLGPDDVYVSIDNNMRIREIKGILATNQWFALTACRYKELVKDYSLYSVFDTDNHVDGRANVHAYIQLGDQAFFAQSFRITDGEMIDKRVVDKVERLCILATYYPSLVRYEKQLNVLKHKPVIVLIGEDFGHCKALNSMIENIYPNVRKLFTFDTLLNEKEAFEGAGDYFEFVSGIPHSVKIEDLL